MGKILWTGQRHHVGPRSNLENVGIVAIKTLTRLERRIVRLLADGCRVNQLGCRLRDDGVILTPARLQEVLASIKSKITLS